MPLVGNLPLLSLLFLFLNHGLAAGSTFNIVSLGAIADGKTDASHAFQEAWANACGSSEPATIYVPNGAFYIQSGNFSGPCKNNAITIVINGTLIASSNIQVLAQSQAWIAFRQINGLSIYGGVIDGQGIGLWNCKHSGKSCPDGATNLEISHAQNVNVNGLSSINSQMFNIVVYGCENVQIQGVNVSSAGDSPNTDGIHVQQSLNVNISSTSIGTGDDCISIGPGTTNLWMENIKCGPGHGISIISPCIGKHDTLNVAFDLYISLFHFRASGVKVSDVTYQDVNGTSASEVAINFDCSPTNPCTGITLEDIQLTYNNQIPKASCKNARGTASGPLQPRSCLA
ncbi:hypothetical protein Csa_008806 [Cucumis sativus]|nr:hypothetical protein Csa_008806 [Cucumis sativus]